MSNSENDPIEDTEEAKEKSSSPEDDQKSELSDHEESEVRENEFKEEPEAEKEGETNVSLEDASPDDLMDILKEIFKIYLAILVITDHTVTLCNLNVR